MTTSDSSTNWLSSWPDLVAFVAGLAVARWAGWNSGDLVWSLWLSSLVVGYSTIVWMIVQPAFALGMASWRERELAATVPHSLAIFWSLIVAGALFFLAFFTFHFGFFHYVHSQILISFFPIHPGATRSTDANMATYVEIARRYWPFLPSAFLAHRHAFQRRPLSLSFDGSTGSVSGGKPRMGALFSEPYRNVSRMHMLLFFFFFAHFAKLENFAVYAVVYAVYFFPWRLVRRPALADQSKSAAPSELPKAFIAS
jgi:hypothetical protein